MADTGPTVAYENELRGILLAHDWEALRDFSQRHNEIPADVYAQPRHFWEVMLHKLICSRIDLLGLHDESRAWLAEYGYTTDLGGIKRARVAMTVRVSCFARIREIVGAAELERVEPEGSTAADCFAGLAAEFPALAALGPSTRFVRAGAFVAGTAQLRDGDELGLLPPYGGG